MRTCVCAWERKDSLLSLPIWHGYFAWRKRHCRSVWSPLLLRFVRLCALVRVGFEIFDFFSSFFFFLVVHPDLLMKTRFVILNCPVLPSIPANRWHCRCVRAPSRPIPLQLQLVWTRYSIPIFGRYFGYHRNDYDGFAFLWFPSQQQTKVQPTLYYNRKGKNNNMDIMWNDGDGGYIYTAGSHFRFKYSALVIWYYRMSVINVIWWPFGWFLHIIFLRLCFFVTMSEIVCRNMRE